VVAEPNQESVQNLIFLLSPTLNLTFGCRRVAMLYGVEITETMPCQVGDKEPANIERSFVK